jgi:ABC-type nitrate/sulfonate/bicarbonate transport system substrate-binding protein
MFLRAMGIVASLALCVSAGPIAAQAPVARSVTVELGDVSATKLAFIVAAENGIYARNGLEVTQFITPGAAENARENGLNVPKEYVRSDLTGDLNIGGGSPTIVRMATVANAPQRTIIATMDTTFPLHLYARPGIRSVRDLRGKRIGCIIVGDVPSFELLALARRLGWNPDKDWVLLSGVLGVRIAGRTNIDAFLVDPLGAQEALELGYHDLGGLTAYKFPILGSGIGALKSWLPSHRAEAAAFVKSTVEAIALLKHNKTAAFAAMEKWYGLTDQARQETLYAVALRSLDSKPYPSAAGLHLARVLFPSREMEIHPDSYFLDRSFVAALDRSGYIDSLYTGR